MRKAIYFNFKNQAPYYGMQQMNKKKLITMQKQKTNKTTQF